MQPIDFNYYYDSIQLIIHHQSPYNNGNFVLNYPPTSLFFFYLFGVMQLKIGQTLWAIFSYIALPVSIYYLLKAVDKKVSLILLLLIFSLASFSFPVKFNLGMGQVNTFILLFLSLCFYFYRIKKIYLSGFFLALAIGIKLFPLFLLLFFLRKKEYHLITTTIVAIAVLGISAIFIFGIDLTKEYLFNVLPNLPAVGKDIYYNQSLLGFLSRLSLPGQTASLLNYLIFLVLLVLSFFKTKIENKSGIKSLLEYGLFIITILIGSGLAWQHHFVLLVIPYSALLLAIFPRKTGNKTLLPFIFLLISFLLVSINISNPNDYLGLSKIFLSHVLFGTVILYLLVLNRLHQTNF